MVTRATKQLEPESYQQVVVPHQLFLGRVGQELLDEATPSRDCNRRPSNQPHRGDSYQWSGQHEKAVYLPTLCLLLDFYDWSESFPLKS